MNHHAAERNRLCHGQRGFDFGQRLAATLFVSDRSRKQFAQLPVGVARRNRRVHRVQGQPGVVEPFGQRPNRCAVVVVEVRTGREDFDAFEPVSGDLDQVFSIEALVVVEVRGNAKARSAHRGLLGTKAKRSF